MANRIRAVFLQRDGRAFRQAERRCGGGGPDARRSHRLPAALGLGRGRPSAPSPRGRAPPMFRKLTDTVFASPQIGLAEVTEAAAQGIALIVNNRPEGESDDQTPGPEIEAAARAAGIGYV